jgi:hypothetical protein
MPVNIIQADGKYVSDAHWRFDRDKVISRISCAGQIGRQRRAMVIRRSLTGWFLAVGRTGFPN